MKKVLAVLLAFCMCMGFAMTAYGDDTGDEVTITYWYQNSNYEGWITKMAEDFHEANPNITVEVELYGDDQALSTALKAAFSEGNAPTLFHTRANDGFAGYVSAGVLEDLSGYDFASRMNEAGLSAASLGDGIYAACLGYSAFCAIYNQDIFDELGLTAPNTFDELVEVVKKCQDAGYGGIAYPGNSAGHVWLSRGIFRTTMTTEGYNAFEEGIDQGTVTNLEDYPDAVSALRSMAAYYSNGLLYNGSESMDSDAEISLFATGECAIMVNYTGQMVAQEALSGINMGIFPLLSESGDGSYYAEVNNMISMSAAASDAEKEAGAKFIDFIMSDENMVYYASELAEVPAVDGIVADHAYGELFESEFSSRGVTMRTVCVTENTEMWKPEYDAMQLGLIFSGYDVDEQVAAFSEHLQEADIASYY